MGRNLLVGCDVLVGDPGEGRVERGAARLATESRERIVAALEPRGGFLPPAPEGWFDATLDAFEANLAGAPEA